MGQCKSVCTMSQGQAPFPCSFFRGRGCEKQDSGLFLSRLSTWQLWAMGTQVGCTTEENDSSTDSSLSVCPAFSFSQPASLQREEKMIKRGKNRKPSYIFIWRRKFRSGPAIEAMNHGFNTIDIECMQMQIPLDRPTFWIPQDMFLGYPVLGMLPSLQGCSRKQDFNCTGVIRSLGNQITGLLM